MRVTKERFTVSNPVAGFIEAHGKGAEARARAASLAKLTGITHHVYDRLARVGAVEQWGFDERGEVFDTKRRAN